jgi:hypothetical protein
MTSSGCHPEIYGIQNKFKSNVLVVKSLGSGMSNVYGVESLSNPYGISSFQLYQMEMYLLNVRNRILFMLMMVAILGIEKMKEFRYSMLV